MKTPLFFLLIVMCGVAVFPYSTRAQVAESTVQFIYFRANDTPPRPDVDAEIDALIKETQLFYADEMERHGFGRKTFQFETDANGNAVVHHIVGKFGYEYYRERWHGTSWAREAAEQINISAKERLPIYMIEIPEGAATPEEVSGHGGLQGAHIYDWHWGILAHEIGHGFGLEHDFRSGSYIMSYGPGKRSELSRCHAEWLDLHPFLNGHQLSSASHPKIKMLPPSLASPPNMIRLRFEVTDPDGLHQVLLTGYLLVGSSVIACQRLNASSSSIVEFVTALRNGGTVNFPRSSVHLGVIDVHGNFLAPLSASSLFSIDMASVLPLSEIVSIPDTNLAAAVREALNLAPGDALTGHAMLRLRELRATDAQITYLTGLEYAHSLSSLDVSRNNISDISPLLALNLTTLKLRGNPLSYAATNACHRIRVGNRGRVQVESDHGAHPAVVKISGDLQSGLAGKPLATPFIVEAQDADGEPMVGVPVTFATYKSEGVLSVITVPTDGNGQARTTFALGWSPGTYSVQASGEGIKGSTLFTSTATELSDRLAADINGDGIVDVEDLVLVAASIGSAPAPGALLVPDTDVNNDGEVNDEDVALVLAALEGAPAAPTLDTPWMTASLQHWIAEAKRRNRADTSFQRGIAVLEALLADRLPQMTALLANYPNPFNPETWIPYQLSEPAEVRLHIYSVEGALVRRLAFGQLPAGIYQSRTRAAYWDGRNELGESVTSGVYFYTLTAGDFTATRKMLIQK